MSALVRGLVVAAVLLTGARLAPARDFPSTPIPDTLRLVPADSLPDPGPSPMRFSPADSLDRLLAEPVVLEPDDTWFRTPFGDGMITPAEMWLARHPRASHRDDDARLALDYNRVDQLRIGAGWEAQRPQTLLPRFGARLEYATGRKRWLWGVQVEQPLAPPSRLVLGASAVRRTDHGDLQHVDDVENTLALLLGRQDYRDYFEREGAGAYLAWRVPDLSTLSLHLRHDRWRSLGTNRGTRSWFHRDRPLRDNPAIDEGESRSVIARSERLARQTHRTRGGFYHWIEVERSGRALGGDFSYTRALADLRSVMRLSPSASLSLRAVAGATTAGELPRQRSFAVGGVDGLRAHAFGETRGDQMVLGQSEVSIGLWPLRSETFQADLQAIAFVDFGRAWANPERTWDVNRQQLEVDGGFGLATAEDEMRVYVARDLRREGDFVISVRLQRPF
jgi:hypothetical protein